MLFNHVSTPTVRIWWNQWGAMAASHCNSLMKVMVWYLESDTHNVQLFFMCLFWFGLTWDFGYFTKTVTQQSYLHTVFVKFVCNLIDFSLCNHSDSRGGIMMSSISWDSMYRVLSILQEIRMEKLFLKLLPSAWYLVLLIPLIFGMPPQEPESENEGERKVLDLSSSFTLFVMPSGLSVVMNCCIVHEPSDFESP